MFRHTPLFPIELFSTEKSLQWLKEDPQRTYLILLMTIIKIHIHYLPLRV